MSFVCIWRAEAEAGSPVAFTALYTWGLLSLELPDISPSLHLSSALRCARVEDVNPCIWLFIFRVNFTYVYTCVCVCIGVCRSQRKVLHTLEL